MLRVVKDDPQDDAIVESAVVGEAQYIVTGDKRHLLPLGSFQGILIITPARLLELIPRA
jgi:predicted nucleic acid-binding protein